MKPSTVGFGQLPQEESAAGGEKRCLNSELWHACAGPLVSLPNVGTRVVYLPQGHSEQVAASTNKEVEGHIPNYPNLPPQLICQLHDVTMHADVETDEVYAQMTLQPLTPEEQKENYLPLEMGIPSKQPTNYFCKTLTASDTSTHGGFSVPRRAAEKVFPPLDFTQQPPAQELIARDIHDTEWKFRHIFRGQPKRHLLTTGWSVFVSAKRLVAGDSVLFIWNEKNQLLLGLRRANRPQTVMPSSVLSSDSMHIGLLAAAAHAASTNSRFTIFYNPRASPSEFVIPLSKYVKAVYHTRVSVGMRFRMLFETEESSVRRYMGTITGISDLDPVRWPNSHWRSVKVGWDESTAGERQPRVSLWELEPLTTFPMYPSLFPLRLNRPWHPGISSLQDEASGFMWLRGDSGERGLQTLGMGPWMQQRMDPLVLRSDQDHYQAMAAAALQDIRSADVLKQQFLNYQQPFQFPQQVCRTNPLLPQQAQPHNLLDSQMYGLCDGQLHSLPHQPLLQSYVDQQKQQGSMHQSFNVPYQLPNDNIHHHHHHHQQMSPLSPSMNRKPGYLGTSASLSPSFVPNCLPNVLGSFPSDGSANLLNFSRITQPIVSEMHQQSWDPKFSASQDNAANAVSLPPFPGKDAALPSENCSADSQNHTLFGVNIDSSSLLSNAVPSLNASSLETDVSTTQYGGSCYQTSLYGCVDDSSGLMQNGEVDPPKTYVKVYKSGSVGRSLDITRFSNYNELREALGRMFSIEGLLEDPLRSGWQLVFVDRENDVLLLGDDPWESFVNNVWYIKILSPEDVYKMGKQSLESFC